MKQKITEKERKTKKKLKWNKMERREKKERNLVIYFQLISYSNANNKEDDTQSFSGRDECNKTCFLSQCKIELQNELKSSKEYYKKRANNVKRKKREICIYFFFSPIFPPFFFVFSFLFFSHHLFSFLILVIFSHKSLSTDYFLRLNKKKRKT